MIYDLVIIGMGPAGVSAAIYAKRAGVNVLCLDKAMIGGYVNYIDRIENYPGMIMSGPDLAFKFYEHIKELDIEFINNGEICYQITIKLISSWQACINRDRSGLALAKKRRNI